jgi:hypothetical protein
MTKVRLYSIWHNKLFDVLYDGIRKDVLDNIVMYGVNPAYTKEYNKERGYTILYEYELPVYEERWQNRGYCQTSCMMHLYKNQDLIADLDYIGFIQYDMKPSQDVFEHIQETLAANTYDKPVVFCDMTHTVEQIVNNTKGICYPYENSVLHHYNNFFKVNITLQDIQNIANVDAPLLHTFVMPKAMFIKMMEWMNILLPHLDDNFRNITHTSQAEFAERIHSLFIVLENVQLVKMKIENVWPLYHNQTEWNMYKLPI